MGRACRRWVGELFGGIELSTTKEKNLKRLKAGLSQIICWPFNRLAAEEFGRIYADLQRRGRLIGPIDMQIAAIALTLGDCTLVSKDNDFSVVTGLSVENWAT